LNLPKISVITASFNSEATIHHAITSVNEQSYPNVEHVFIDGASQDRSLDIIKKESRVENRVISEPDSGIYDALNKGIQRATGDVIGFLHADDYFDDSFVLETIANRFANVEMQAIFGDLKYVSQENPEKSVRYWRAGAFSKRRLEWGWMPPHPTLYIRKNWYERIGGFDTQYRISADYDSILKLFCQPGFKADYIPQVLVNMRLGGISNNSIGSIIQKMKEDLLILDRSEIGGVGTLIGKNLQKVQQFWMANRMRSRVTKK
jgi:glycosyltransferase involved in cell wall biosynthesis